MKPQMWNLLEGEGKHGNVQYSCKVSSSTVNRYSSYGNFQVFRVVAGSPGKGFTPVRFTTVCQLVRAMPLLDHQQWILSCKRPAQ